MRPTRILKSLDRSCFAGKVRIHAREAVPAAGSQRSRALLEGSWFPHAGLRVQPPRSLPLKRVVDLLVSTTAFLLILPLLIVISLLIKIDSRGPVIFRQMRVGAGARPFRIYKFRTMVDDAEKLKPSLTPLNMHAYEHADPRMFKVPNDPRTTHVGMLLRRYALDELPQLINVLRGDMSLVGPRPLIEEEDRYVTGWARRRLEVRPGMTGLWQVRGGSEIPFGEMTRLDNLYVTSWSLSGDLRILLETLPAVLAQRRGCK